MNAGTETGSAVLLTVRGKLVPENLEAARKLHNETAGSPPGIAAARALGDLSHQVYMPAVRNKKWSAADGEILFLDRWDSPQGVIQFFSNTHVQEQAGRMFSARDAVLWMPARGAFTCQLPAPKARSERYIGMLRVAIETPEPSIENFANVYGKVLREARSRGLLSHELFVKLRASGEESALELLAIESWHDLSGMTEHYQDSQLAALSKTWAGPPQATVWEQASGDWSEW